MASRTASRNITSHSWWLTDVTRRSVFYARGLGHTLSPRNDMTRLFTVLCLAALLSASPAGQSPAPAAFEFADVRSSPPPTFPNQAMRGGALRAGNYEVYYATMVDLVRLA